MTPEQKKRLIEVVTTFMMRAGQEGHSPQEIEMWTAGFLQAVQTAFGEAAEQEVYEEIMES